MACTSGGSTSDLSSDECSDACAKIDAANCGDADEGCVGACLRSSNSTDTSSCRQPNLDYARCFWTAASYTCNAAVTVAVGCDDARAAAEACSAAGADAGGADAGGASAVAGAGGTPDGGTAP